MDESALRTALASLDNCSSSLNWWFEFWTFLVAVGVVLEVVFVIWEYRDELHDFRRGIIHPPEHPRKLLFFLGLLGAALVAIGVSGEFWEESRIAITQTCIRKGNDVLSLLLSKEAGDAAKSAKIAQGSSDAAGKASEKAQKKAEAAETSAIRTGKLASQAESDAANTADKLEQVTLLLEYASLAGHRSFDFRDLENKLQGLPPMKAVVVYTDLDSEGKALASLLARTLSGSGWHADPTPYSPHSLLPCQMPTFGISICNRWASAAPSTFPLAERGPIPPAEVMRAVIGKLTHEGVPPTNAKQLAFLAHAIQADLKQGKVEDNFVWILVGREAPNAKK